MVKKVFFFVIIFLTINISVALPTIVKKDLHEQNSAKFNYTELAITIQERLNNQTDPCDDFYEFACGGLLNGVEIPDDLNEIGVIGSIEEDTRYQLRDVLNQTVKSDDIAPFKLAKRFYKMCLDEESIEKLGSKPLIQLIGKNKWPLAKQDAQNLPDLHELIKTGKDSGILSYALISVSVDTNLDNSSEFILYIDQHDSYLSQEIYLDGISDPVMVAYQAFVEQVMRKVDQNVKNPNVLAKEIVEFEIDLARIAERREDRRDLNLLDNHMTLEELIGNFTYINWIEYINAILPKGKPGVTKNEHVIVGDVKYFEKLGELLKKTPKYIIYNYIQWSIIAETLTLLSKDFRTDIANLDKVLYGTSAESLRWDECIALSMEMMPSIVGAMYIREYFTDESRKTVTEMLENIIHEFKELLKDVDWMDSKTKKTALEKIDKLNYFVGYADELANLTLLEHYYQEIIRSQIIAEDLSFFDMTLAISKFSLDEAFNFLYEKTVQRSDWRFIQSPATVNAFYLSSHNHIEILAAILQNEIFSLDRPAFLNYAALGHVIGHEITHALDDMGRQFDSTGNLKNWWHNETLEKYVQKAKCFVNQYSEYTVDNQHVDGVNSLGENIADNGGFKVAYRTYKKILKDDIEQELRDAGFNYTRDQLFWISGAQTWCTKRRKESVHIMMETGDHPLEQFRVIGSLSNNKDFSKDFNCPVGSRMNPKTKCEIW